jgi:hypothetical protein
MEEIMKRSAIPNTDSLAELARFWDCHELTDFSDELEEVTEPVFAASAETSLRIPLRPAEARHLSELAKSKGVKQSTIVRRWIAQKIKERSGVKSARRG